MVYLSKASACDRWLAVADSIRLVREYVCTFRCYRFHRGAFEARAGAITYVRPYWSALARAAPEPTGFCPVLKPWIRGEESRYARLGIARETKREFVVA